MTFTRPANHRQLTFTEIAQSAKIPVNEVIWTTSPQITFDINPGLTGLTFSISLFGALKHLQKSILPTLFVCWCPAGGAPGDEGSVCGSDQREHWWGGSEGADDLGAAQGARSAAGQSTPTHPKATPANVDYIRNQTSVKSKALKGSVTLCFCTCSTDQRYEGAFGLLVWRREEHGHAGGAAGPWHPDLNQFSSSSEAKLGVNSKFSIVFSLDVDYSVITNL